MSEGERHATPAVDYLRPIVADGDTGHGGLTSVMKLTKMFIEKGAAGIHFEDQKVLDAEPATRRETRHYRYAQLNVPRFDLKF